MYTTSERRMSPVFNNMMYQYKDWHNNDYHVQHIMDSSELSNSVITDTIKRAGRYIKKQRYKRNKIPVSLPYSYNDEGYPLDNLDDTYMKPLKYYSKGFNCKTMSPTKD